MFTGYPVDLHLDLECLSCPMCKIDLSSRILAQRKQHVRRCNQPPPSSDGMYYCDVCSSSYKTFAGLRQHIKRIHPVEYNDKDVQLQEIRASASRAKWSTAEERQLARLEVLLPTGLPQKEINIRLASQHPGRSADGIKKQRLKQSYKDILLEIVSETTIASCSTLPCSSQSSQSLQAYGNMFLRSPRIRLERIDSIAPWNRTLSSTSQTISTENVIVDTHPIDNTCFLIKHADICIYIKELSSSCSVNIQNLIYELFNANNFDSFDPIISSAINNLSRSKQLSDFSNEGDVLQSKKKKRNIKTIKKKNSTKSKPKQNRAAVRASIFSTYQHLFSSNPTQLAHAILDDKELNTSVFPNMSDIEAEFRPIFEECPPYSGSTPIQKEIIHLDYPITFRETELALHRLKQSACGPDGLNREDLRRANMADLVGLLNIVFGLCHTPSILRHNRTVLIPKKGDLSIVSNWRPITVSSIFTRLLHKILASRLSENIKLHHAQRGFTPCDGVMSSSTILDTIVREHRVNGKQLFVLSIDLSKAFDKIHPLAIENSLISQGIDSHTVRYIMSTYSNVDTIIECHGQRSSPISMRRGVRQGDTDSPILFNIALDEFVKSIDTSYGVNLGEAKIGCLLFADDIVLLSYTQHGMREHLHQLQSFLRKTHMEVNPSKCRALQLTRISGTKRTTVDTKSYFSIHDIPIPTLKVLQQLKYLGHNYNQYGMIAPSASNLESMLERLKRAALRPWQKLYILNRYLIPRLMHCNQSSDITAGKLDHIDRLIRRFVKATLHLPVTTPTSYMYAKIRDGGLSIPCLRHQIGVIYRRRLQRICLQNDPDFNAAFDTPSVKRLMRKLDIICQGIPTARSAVARHWATNLHQSALGNGLKYNTQSSNSWILNPPPFWTGRDYIRAIQLRIGLPPTGGAPYINADAAQCRYPTCVGRRETLSHILQWCPVTHYQRIQRHDRATQDLASHLKAIGLNIQEAPRINTRDNRYIPDLLVIDKEKSTCSIIETTIVWEHGSSLLDAARIKRDKYNIPEILNSIKVKYNLTTSPVVLPFVVGARGGWPPSNNIIWRQYKLPHYLQRKIVCNVLRYGSSIHRYFMSHTWRKRKKKK
ncbi:Retrovirus-related Pol polyprotein from type-1 retrotransposable element R2 (Fragment) [Anthophora plagiata]